MVILSWARHDLQHLSNRYSEDIPFPLSRAGAIQSDAECYAVDSKIDGAWLMAAAKLSDGAFWQLLRRTLIFAIDSQP